MPTYRLTLEYDGTKFLGWQVQPRGRTVQGTLLDALREALGERHIDLQGAGRTDAGVHALGQVASLRCPRALDPHGLAADLERRLPADLAVLEIAPAPRGFHARHDAVRRVYRYQLATRRSAFGKRFTWWVGPLDARAMRHAAAAFVGRHDFATFAKRAVEAESTVVVVDSCEVAVAGDLVLCRIAASHFLWNQVRRMVGALVAVATGEAAAADVPRWLAGELAPPAQAAPAAGLFLEAVDYQDARVPLLPLAPVGVPVHPGHGNVRMGTPERGRA